MIRPDKRRHPPSPPSPDGYRAPVLARLRESFAHAPRTLKLVWRSSPAGSVSLGLLTLVAAVVPLGIAWVGKATMDAVVARSVEAALGWVLAELGLIALQSLVQRALGLVRSLLGARLS